MEVKVQYDGPSPSVSGCTADGAGTKTCNVTITAPKDMDPPIFVYYELDNFYQNHRRYVKSVSAGQLDGDFGSPTTDCDPLNKAPNGKTLFPCGLIANSMFNGGSVCGCDPQFVRVRLWLLPADTFTLTNTSFSLNEKDISWPSDRKTKYKELPAGVVAANQATYQFLNETYPGVIGNETSAFVRSCCVGCLFRRGFVGVGSADR